MLLLVQLVFISSRNERLRLAVYGLNGLTNAHAVLVRMIVCPARFPRHDAYREMRLDV